MIRQPKKPIAMIDGRAYRSFELIVNIDPDIGYARIGDVIARVNGNDFVVVGTEISYRKSGRAVFSFHIDPVFCSSPDGSFTLTAYGRVSPPLPPDATDETLKNVMTHLRKSAGLA